MLLSVAVTKLIKEFGSKGEQGLDAEKIGAVIGKFSGRTEVNVATMDKLMNAGRALRKLGVS